MNGPSSGVDPTIPGRARPARSIGGCRAVRQTAMFVGLAFTMLTAVAGPARAETSAPPPSTAALQPTLPGASTIPTGREASDRLAILDLLHRYSHLADALETEAFGALFTPDARFTIVFPESAPGLAPAPQVMGSSRKEIVAALRDRHATFRAEGVQRRHFLTNPIVWDQTPSSARVAVYLQLRTSTRGGPSAIVGTGRYEGRVVETDSGWRIAEWTLFSDQRID
ncbi:MAG: nuclear transport factor 2 family protein [Spirochaetaceae bacterium]|nr:nuclear transport factor 2 family protein [Myxococcales bacterium]MCB9726075.1 nuclear transport factor 2 family protein [Spirochaetaceae bacterium]